MFTINASQLRYLTKLPCEVAPPRTSLPVIDCTLFDVKGGLLTIAGTDLSVYVKNQMNVISDSDFAICVPHRFVENYLATATGELIVSCEKGKLTIKQDKARSRFTLDGIDSSEFPSEMPFDDNSPCITMKTEELKSIIRRTIFASSNDEIRYVLNSIAIGLLRNPDDSVSVTFSATDGIRAVHNIVEAQLSDDLLDAGMDAEKGKVNLVVIPIDYCKMLLKLDSEVITIAVNEESNRIAVDITNEDGVRTVIKAVTIDGNFPDIDAVTPRDASLKGSISVHTLDFIKAIKRCLLFKSETEFVKITLVGDNVVTISASGESGNTETDVECSNDGELKQLVAGFEGKYMIEQLRAIGDELDPFAVIKFLSPKSPFVIVPRDSPIKYKSLLMPKHIG